MIRKEVSCQKEKGLFVIAINSAPRDRMELSCLADALVSYLGNKDIGQFVGSMQARKRYSITAVILNPLLAFFRSTGRINNGAIKSLIRQRSVSIVAAWPGSYTKWSSCFLLTNFLTNRSNDS